MDRYYKISKYYKDRYGEKVYRLPINILGSCPNRADGSGGCIFCAGSGSFEQLSSDFTVQDQLQKNKEYIQSKYKANKFIAYFQSYTMTYMPVAKLEKLLEAAMLPDVVGISISTRPDCVSDDVLDFLAEFKSKHKIDIELELGLQSTNDKTLKIINRGHDLACFINAAKRVKNREFFLVVHLIANLPWDTEADILKAIELISELGIDAVKFHSLYVLRNTKLAEIYPDKESIARDFISSDEYVNRLVKLIRLLPPSVVVLRMFGRAPETEAIFCNWDTSWRKLQNELENRLVQGDYRQGDLWIK